MIMFYSNTIFKGLSMSTASVTALIGIVNFVATLIGLAFLICAGRRTLMLWFNSAMTLTLFLLATFSFAANTEAIVICVLLFIAFFEFSSGVIIFLYLAEVMQDKALSIAIFLNWMGCLAISISIPYVVKAVAVGYVFLFFAVTTLLGTIFVFFFMRETRGKTQAEIDKAFEDSEETTDVDVE